MVPMPADEARYTVASGCLVFSAALVAMVLIGSGKFGRGCRCATGHRPGGTDGSWAVGVGGCMCVYVMVSSTVSSHAAADKARVRPGAAFELWQVRVAQE
jgi:hypothetical protein